MLLPGRGVKPGGNGKTQMTSGNWVNCLSLWHFGSNSVSLGQNSGMSCYNSDQDHSSKSWLKFQPSDSGAGTSTYLGYHLGKMTLPSPSSSRWNFNQEWMPGLNPTNIALYTRRPSYSRIVMSIMVMSIMVMSIMVVDVLTTYLARLSAPVLCIMDSSLSSILLFITPQCTKRWYR